MNKHKTAIIFSALVFVLIAFGCNDGKTQTSSESETHEKMENNSLLNLTNENPGNFKWLNEPKSFNIENGSINVLAEKGTDFFNNPEDSTLTSTAPFLYQEVSGDFVATTLVRPDFSSMWNAVALMVHIDDNSWIKFAFENSDATGRSIVSVVTKGVSDDANGAILNDKDVIWLKLIRKANIYSMFWSLDGVDYKMSRLTSMPVADTIKVGLEFQSPVGKPAEHEVDYFQIKHTTVQDLRKGE